MQQFQPASMISSGRFHHSHGRLTVGLALLLVLLAACSRQADGPFEPIDGSTPTLPSTAVSQSIDGTVVPGTDFSGGSSTLPPLPTEDVNTENEAVSTTVIEPPSTEEEDAVTVFTLDPDAPPIFTLAASPTWTPNPDGSTGLGTEEATATLSGDFITPGAPQGPVDLTEGSTSIDGTAEVGTGTGDLLPTPTDLLNFSGTDVAEVDDNCIYVVQRGDSLFGISLELEVSLDDLRAINPEVQETDVIQVDQELIIPNCDEDFVLPIDELDEEDATPVGGATLLPTPRGGTTETDEGSSDETGRTHTVASGETLFIIAQEYGVTIDAIVEANNLANPNQLDIGQLLIIPDTE